MSYYPCELHTHTVHSDGDFKVNELQAAAVAEGYRLIALTDHNTYTGYNEIDNAVIPTVRGIEWTTFYGHMLVLGGGDFTDWRSATPDNIDEKINYIRQNGGLVGVAHPFSFESPICTGGKWQFNVKNWNLVNYIEVWHESLAPINVECDKAFSFWTALLDKGHKLAATNGRDWHRQEDFGYYGSTFLDMENVCAKEALNAIRLGRTVVSHGIEFYFEALQNGKTFKIGDTVGRGECTLKFSLDRKAKLKNLKPHYFRPRKIRITTNGNTPVRELPVEEQEVKIELQANHWYRAELLGTVDGVGRTLAFTSPIYCEY